MNTKWLEKEKNGSHFIDFTQIPVANKLTCDIKR